MPSTNKPIAAGIISVIASRKPKPSVSLNGRSPSRAISADWRASVGKMAMLMAVATKPCGNWTSVVAHFM